MTYFLHYVAHGGFADGVYMPFNTKEEAERQAAWEIHHGADPEVFEGVFAAEYKPGPKFGWKLDEVDESPHHDPNNREKIHTNKQLIKAAVPHIDVMLDEMRKAEEDRLLDMHKQIEEGRTDYTNAVPGNAYSWCTGGTATATPAALSAATAKTVCYIVTSTICQPALVEFSVSFDGVTASAVPVLVELISSTTGTAGTPRATLAAGKQERGWPAQTSQTTAGDTYSAEPGTQLVNRKWYLTPNGGLMVIQLPLGREATGIVTATTDGKAWGLRCTAPATVNCHSYAHWEE